MSKASEWAKSVREAEVHRDAMARGRPQTFYLKLGPGRTVDFEVHEDGAPCLNAPLVAHERLEVGPLLDLARWIIATFDEDTAR